MKKASPTVNAYSKKGWHFQLDAKKGEDRQSANQANLATSDEEDAKSVAGLGAKGAMVAKQKKERDEKDEKLVAEKKLKLEAKEAEANKGKKVDELQQILAKNKAKVETDTKKYTKDLGMLQELALKMKDRLSDSMIQKLPEKLKNQLAKEKRHAEKVAAGLAAKKEKPPRQARKYELESRKLDKKTQVDQVRSFDDAVFEQIQAASTVGGQRLSPGQYCARQRETVPAVA